MGNDECDVVDWVILKIHNVRLILEAYLSPEKSTFERFLPSANYFK